MMGTQEEMDELICKSRAYDQVRWERDIAIEQLNEAGYEFGEKISKCVWKLEDTTWHWECEDEGGIGFADLGLKIMFFNYCPFCGKKIQF